MNKVYTVYGRFEIDCSDDFVEIYETFSSEEEAIACLKNWEQDVSVLEAGFI